MRVQQQWWTRGGVRGWLCPALAAGMVLMCGGAAMAQVVPSAQDGVPTEDFPRFLKAARDAVPDGRLIDVRPMVRKNRRVLAFFFEVPGGGMVEVRARLPDEGAGMGDLTVQRSKPGKRGRTGAGDRGRDGRGKDGRGKGDRGEKGGKGPGPGPDGPAQGNGHGPTGGKGGKT